MIMANKQKKDGNKTELLLAKFTSDYITVKDELEQKNQELINLRENIVKLLKHQEGNKFEFMEETYGVTFKHRFKLFKSVRINYDVDKLKEKLTKKQQKKLIRKTVGISNFDEFAEFMKEKGIKFSEVKPFLQISEKVETKALENMYEIGEIDLQEISDCYTVNTTFSMRHTATEIKPDE